jgi:cysteine-rich repeat protein
MRTFFVSLCFLLVGCPGGLCGDNSLDAGEACDDGNTNDADGCEANCSLPACKNGIVDPGEVCFFEPVLFETDLGPQNIIAADFNGDNNLDLVTANSAGNSLGVLLGDGAGGFVRAPDVELVQVTFFVVAGDFDGDNVLDLAASLSELDRVELFRGSGAGLFEPLVTLPVLDPDSLVVADFDGDQLPDLASTSDSGVVVFRGDGVGGFLAPLFSLAGSRIFGLQSSDFNGDSSLDLIALTKDNEDDALLLLGDGAGNFAVQAPQPVGPSGDIIVEDFNGDSSLDFVVGRLFASEVGFFTGDDLGAFSEVQTIEIRSPSALAAGDINGDGVLDVAAASGLDQKDTAHLAVFISDGADSFALPLLFSAGFSDPRGLVLADFNGDGALDSAMTDQGFGRVIVFLSQP